MKKIKFVSAILIAALAAQLLTVAAAAKVVVGISGEPEASGYTQPLSIPSDLPTGNRLPLSAFDDLDALINWECGSTFRASPMRLECLFDENGGYLRATDRAINTLYFTYTPLVTYTTGIYKFTGYFRTYYEDEVTSLRIQFIDDYGKRVDNILYVNCDNDWVKVEYYVTVPDTLKKISINGDGWEQFVQDFCMDEFSLVKVAEIPEGFANSTRFGLPKVDVDQVMEQTLKHSGVSEWDEELESKYKVNGIMVNHDADALQYSIGELEDMSSVTVQDLVELARQYKDSHVTDFLLCVNNEVTNYPSNVWTSYIDKYYQKEEAGQAVDWTGNAAVKGNQYLWETLSIDYVGLWCDVFTQMGINTWISFRMNDAHERDTAIGVSHLMSDFFHENPQFYRVKHHTYSEYYDKIYDFTHEEVRERFLQLINESLSRYNCYGIELDFQREAYLWYIGGEYNGLDIFNQFMRDIDDLLAIYEEKYGHELKFAVRVPSDPMTCYELGLDVVTWAAEGIVDHVTAGGRFMTTDTDIPIRLWDSLLEPHGVTLAASIEQAYISHSRLNNVGGATLELLAGIAANAYSQGADKVYLFNYLVTVTEEGPITEEDKKASVTRDGSYKGYNTVTDNTDKWIFYNTIGSYDKVIEMNRRFTPTYNDVKTPWATSYKNQVLPCRIKPDVANVFRIAVGDVTVGSKLTFMISAPKEAYVNKELPVVYVNSQPCKFLGIGDPIPLAHATYTQDKVLMYEIPVEAHDQTYMVVEIMAKEEFGCEHFEIFVEAPVH